MPNENTAPLFTGEVRSRLETGKYSRWATDLTAEQLETILWALGIIQTYEDFSIEQNDECYSSLPLLSRHPIGDARMGVAIQALCEIAEGQGTTIDELCKRDVEARYLIFNGKPSDLPISMHRRLSGLLHRLAVLKTEVSGDVLTISLSGESTLRIRAADDSLVACSNALGTIHRVRRSDNDLYFQFVNGSFLKVTIAAAEGCIELIGENGRWNYRE